MTAQESVPGEYEKDYDSRAGECNEDVCRREESRQPRHFCAFVAVGSHQPVAMRFSGDCIARDKRHAPEERACGYGGRRADLAAESDAVADTERFGRPVEVPTDNDASRLVSDYELRFRCGGRNGNQGVEGVDSSDFLSLDRGEYVGRRSLNFVGGNSGKSEE